MRPENDPENNVPSESPLLPLESTVDPPGEDAITGERARKQTPVVNFTVPSMPVIMPMLPKPFTATSVDPTPPVGQ